MKTITINNQDYFCPEIFQEINFGLWEEIQIMFENNPSNKITYDLTLDIIELITKIDRKIVLSTDSLLFRDLRSTLSFVFHSDELSKITFQNFIEMEGEKYYINEDPNCTGAEYIDRDFVLEEFESSKKLSGMCAIFLRPKGIKYSSDDLEERIKLIKQQPCTAIFPMLGFFLLKGKLLSKSMQAFSMGLQVYQVQQMELENWQRSGAGNTSYFNWRKKICGLWMNSSNERFMNCLTSYHTLQTRLSQNKINLELNK